ncbi:MAG: hypothetical protein ACOVQC_05740 [Flavobacterium sp.]
MKKLMFTAIALVAFSGVSMANTIADDEVVSKKQNNEKILKTDSECMKYASLKVEAYESQYGCMTSSQYNYSFWGHYNKCLDKTIGIE